MYKTVVLLLLTAFIAEGRINFHEQISQDDLVHYFGTTEKDEVPEYEIVSPRHVRGSRRRRGLYEDKEPLEYVLQAFGDKYHLHLQHNRRLISPGCLVYNLQGNGQKHVEPCPVNEDDCYYLGSSVLHNNSSAAVSTCDGLHGIISVSSHDLVVQPVRKQHIPILLSSQPVPKSGQYVADSNAHIVYKMTPKKRSCGLQAAADRLLKVTRRRRRQAGRKYIEFLLTADKTMFQYHGDDLQRYMLTAANVAAGRYLDPSLHQEIYLTVVRIKILQDDQPGLVITSDADSSLTSFCSWQEKFNPQNDDDPQHVDAATLMTRMDLIHLGVQSTTGLASLSGMCSRNIRCSILEDNGLDIGLTFAHETGHSLGMSHDGENNFCDDRHNIMSASGAGGSTAFLWSSCSVESLSNFLSSGKGSCMNDEPQRVGYSLPRDLPGVVYDGTDQCELFIDKGSSLCTGTSLVDRFGGDECAKLICFDPNLPGQCTGSQAPRMDGTECGHRKWCIHGQCVDIGPNGPSAQDGHWSDWDREWSTCSRSCGGGVRTKTRKCNNPKPLFGGKPCEGYDSKAELCNMQSCAASADHKADQCAATDQYPLFNQNFHFVPANVEGKDQCKLYCEIAGQSTIHLRTLNGKQQFTDGTDCRGDSGPFHRCVSGVCRAFSCDGSTESKMTYDKCGVCKGDNSSCKKITGTYHSGEAKKYSTFANIPKGATSIYITNQNKYSVMSIAVNGIRYFNGADGHRDRSGKYSGGGVTVEYRRNPEKITVDGPLSVNIEAQVYRLYGDEYQGVNPQILFDYYIPHQKSRTAGTQWKTVDGTCSVTCGQGTLTVDAMCVDPYGRQVESYHCNLHNKPSTSGKACTMSACPAQWVAGSFSACSKTCGGGVQTRQVQCVQLVGAGQQVVANGNCPAGSKPSSSQTCGDAACAGTWRTGAWSACSQTCARGVKTREVKCYRDANSNQEVAESSCVASEKPVAQTSCIAAPCNPHITGDKCKDNEDCKAYGDNVCSEYGDWAKQNCQEFCGFCVKNPTAGTSLSSNCKDVATNCAGYGKDACAKYKEWAHANCAKYCGVCRIAAATTAAATTAAAAVSDGSCVDAKSECKDYGDNVCTKYKEWAAQNCKKKCGLCKGKTQTSMLVVYRATTFPLQTVTVSGDCEDLQPCAAYGANVCTQYGDWAKQNCKKYCGLCANKQHMFMEHSTSTSMHHTIVKSTRPNDNQEMVTTVHRSSQTAHRSDCKDVQNCAQYGKSVCTQYHDWANQNCQRFCNFCFSNSVVVTSSASDLTDTHCKDVQDCSVYGPDVCTKYKQWASINCKKTCNLCNIVTQPTSALLSTSPRSLILTSNKALSTVKPTHCTDLTNCTMYGTGVCNQYRDWALQNCKRFCGLCAVVTHPTQTPVITEPTEQKKNDDPNCKDTQDCTVYSKKMCTQYQDWAHQNCKLFCGLCGQTSKESTTQTGPALKQDDKQHPECKDLQDCKAYDKKMCTQYQDWAHQNCKQFCGLCGQSSKTTQTDGVKPDNKQHSDCKDQQDCTAFGKNMCNLYKDWAHQNCKSYCGFCGQTTLGPSSPTTIEITSASYTSPSPSLDDKLICKDVFDCKPYGKIACTLHKDWAFNNCKQYCGFCNIPKQSTETPLLDITSLMTTSLMTSSKLLEFLMGNNCRDLQDCGGPTSNICHQQWAFHNCKKSCKFCDNSLLSTISKVMPTRESKRTNETCRDLTDCSAYGNNVCKEFNRWAKVNCKKYCGYCSLGTKITEQAETLCKDKVDCSGYNTLTCKQYPAWARQNCPFHCNLCRSEKKHTAAYSLEPTALVTSGVAVCKDDQDCGTYGSNVCKDYKEWASQNCRKYCNLCSVDSDQNGNYGGNNVVGYGDNGNGLNGNGTGLNGNGNGLNGNGNGLNGNGNGLNGNGNGHNGNGNGLNGNGNGLSGNGNGLSGNGNGLNGNGNGNTGNGHNSVPDDDCKDETACNGYPTSVCTEYKDWAKQNCKKKCAYCGAKKGNTCSDITNTCSDYGKTVCTNYKQWAQHNCKQFCGFCSEDCKDTANCAAYGANVCKEYADWSKINCKKTCNHCSK